MNKNQRPPWILLLLLAAGVLAFALLGNQLRVSYRTPLSGCVYDDGTGGASGMYRWCGRMGVPTTVLDVPLWEAPAVVSKQSGNVLMTMGDGPWSPSGDKPEPSDLQAVREWLERGNALIIVTRKLSSAPPEFLKQISAGDLLPTESKADPPVDLSNAASLLGFHSVESRPSTVKAPTADYGTLTVEAQGTRWLPPEPEADGEASSKPADAPPRTTAADRWQLAGDTRGGVLFRIPVGKGACYVLLDAFAWSNAGLDAGDNAGVLAKILKGELRDGSLVIDEHRHGHGRAESFLTFLLTRPGASAFLWLALAWSLLFYYARNVRLRPVERYVEQERRTAQEYINAVAQLHERARAAPLAVEAVAGRLRQLARASFEHEPTVESLLREADAYIEAGRRPASPDDAIRLVTELVQLRKRLYGSRTVS